MDEQAMAKLTKTFLAKHSAHATQIFRQLIDDMTAKSVSKVLLTYHPSYQLKLGIAGTDKGRDVLETSMELVPNFDDEHDTFVADENIPRDDNGDDDDWLDEEVVWEWIRESWLAADGRKSGRTAVLLDNGMADEVDLSTGEEPDPALGFDKLA